MARGAAKSPSTKAMRHAISPRRAASSPPTIPLTPATRPLRSTSIAAASPIRTPPAAEAQGVKCAQSMVMRDGRIREKISIALRLPPGLICLKPGVRWPGMGVGEQLSRTVSRPIARARGADLARSSYALVLAGGRGSRLKELTDWRCKPAVPFGGKYRIIDFTLSNCVNSGVRRIGVTTQYKAHSLIRHLQRGWSFLDGRIGEHVDILPAQQQIGDNWYRGTADAVFQNLNILRRERCDYVLVLSGDHVYKMDYGRLLEDHAAWGADATVVCVDVPLEDARGFGVLEVDAAGRVVGFEEKPSQPRGIPGAPGRALASMGVY